MSLDAKRFNCAVPRYTSYPTAPEWAPLSEQIYAERLRSLSQSKRPLSLYLHIPFCTKMCLYCACSVVLNRRLEREQAYVDALCHEMENVGQRLEANTVKQIHFGGGTPTQLSERLLDRLMDQLASCFPIDWTGEISIEIDPRTVSTDKGAKLRFLRALGFNRVSFGVQDTNAKVQRAVRRDQSWEVTRFTYLLARELGFCDINLDLIYGLPYQTRASFKQTIIEILSLRPNRVALYSYAKVPWLKPHQKAIREATLPGTDEKFAIYVQARQQFLDAGYLQIGMDHFALPTDSMAKAFFSKQLQRNFQGYSLKLAEDLVGLGLTATGLVDGCYAQNVKELAAYYQAIKEGRLPVSRGKLLSLDDQIRKWTIHHLMCDFELDAAHFSDTFGVAFDDYFKREQVGLDQLIHEGLLERVGSRIRATEEGSLFIRNVASHFDAYLEKAPREGRFSKGV